MTVVHDSHMNNLKANILNGLDPDAKVAIAAINKEIEYLEAQIYAMQRCVKFARLTSEIYTIPVDVAAWLELTISAPAGIKEKLQYLNVREYAGRTWLASTNGHRLHAYAINLPVGVYTMIGNKLRQVDSDYPDWTTIMPSAPAPVAIDDYAVVNEYAAWNFINGNLVKFDPKRIYKLNENYRLNQRYYKEALSLGGEPQFFLSKPTEKHPAPYQRKFLITWPGAFALIQPVVPKR